MEPEASPDSAQAPAPPPAPPGPAAPPPRAFPRFPARVLALALGFYGLMLAVAGLWALLAGRSLLYAGPEGVLRGVRPLADAGAGLLAAAAVVVVSQLLTRHTRWGDRMGATLAGLLGRRSWPECLALAAMSGVAEEALFRGALQPAVGLPAATLLFGLAHFAPRRELLPWTAFSLAAGLLLGGLFEVTGNLVAPVFAHAAINAVNLRWLTQRYT